MDTDKLIQLSNKVKARMTAGGLNEEQTKTALILPFFMALGYDILEDVQSQRFRLQASEFIGRVHAGNLPSDFIDFLASKYSVNSLEKSKLAAIFNESYKQTVLSKPGDKIETVTVTADKSEQKKEQEKLNRSKAEDLPIGVPILFNTGNLAFHKPSSICIKGVEYQINSLAEMITSTMSYIINNIICDDKDGLDKFRTGLVERPLSIKLYESMNEALNDSVRGIRNIPHTGLYISTAFDAKTMQSIIEKAIGIVGISNDEVKIVLIR